MGTGSFSQRLLEKLVRAEMARNDDELARERFSEGVVNVHRDQRDNRLPGARFQLRQGRKFLLALGALIGLFMHRLSGVNLLVCVVAFGACSVLIFEWLRQIKVRRDAHFD